MPRNFGSAFGKTDQTESTARKLAISSDSHLHEVLGAMYKAAERKVTGTFKVVDGVNSNRAYLLTITGNVSRVNDVDMDYSTGRRIESKKHFSSRGYSVLGKQDYGNQTILGKFHWA
jgi:hypothetical protein